MGWYSQWKLAFSWGCGNYNRSPRGVTVVFNGWSAAWREFPVPLLKWRISQGGQNKKKAIKSGSQDLDHGYHGSSKFGLLGSFLFTETFMVWLSLPRWIQPGSMTCNVGLWIPFIEISSDMRAWPWEPQILGMAPSQQKTFKMFQHVSAFQPSQSSPATWKSSLSAAKAPGVAPGARMLRRSCHGTMADCTTPFANRMSSRFPNLCSALTIDFGHFSWAVGVSFQQEIQLAAPKLENIRWLLIHNLKTLDMPFWGMPRPTRGPRATRGTMSIVLQQPHHTWHHTHAFSGYEGTASSGCRNFTHH